MRKLLASLAVGALLATGSTVAVSSSAAAAPTHAVVASQATSGTVTVKKITTKTAPYGGKATVKPRVVRSGPVVVRSKTITVKQSGRTIAKNKKKVALKAGTYKVTTKVTYQRYDAVTKKAKGSVKTKTLKQTLVVKKGKRPSRTTPTSAYNCPSWAPIKGNQTTSHTSDWIYHVPGGRYYKVTKPEECFTTESAARQAGYRASRNG